MCHIKYPLVKENTMLLCVKSTTEIPGAVLEQFLLVAVLAVCRRRES